MRVRRWLTGGVVACGAAVIVIVVFVIGGLGPHRASASSPAGMSAGMSAGVPTTTVPVPVPVPTDEDGGTTDVDPALPPVTMPLVPVPTGCAAPRMPHVVFLGTVVARDDRTVRFRIDDIRAGHTAPFGSATAEPGEEQIDVRYGLDVQYLVGGEQYLVGAVVDPALGYLVSRTSPPTPDFGGDEVIGVSETDVNCPDYEDPMVTLHGDGTVVDAPRVQGFFDAKVRLALAFLVPFGLCLGALFVLASMRLSVVGAWYRATREDSTRRAG